MTSTLRDLEDGTTVCTACGREVVDGHKCSASPLAQETQEGGVIDRCLHGVPLFSSPSCEICFPDTQNPPLTEGSGSSALPGMAAGRVAEASVADAVKPPDAWVYQPGLPPGAFRTADHRYYWNGQGPNPSVTTVLNDVLLKHGLDYYKRASVARAIWRDSKGFFGEAMEHGEDQAVKWALKAAEEERDTAAQMGTSVHLLADMAARATESDSAGFQVSEQEKPYLQAFQGFLAFLEAHSARIVSSEHMVWSDLGYAGTYDLIVQMPCGSCIDCRTDFVLSAGQKQEAPDCLTPQLWMVDIKTSKGVYPEYALQLMAYGKADRIILEGTPESFPMPKIDRYAVLHLRPDQYPDSGFRLYEYPVTDEDFYRFVSVLDLYLWRKEDRYRKSNLITVT